MSRRQSLRHIWRRPITMGLLTVVGLLSALFGGGGWRMLSWLCLTLPLTAGVRYLTSKVVEPR